MMIEATVMAAALLVAFSNGANDNFKGFATVWGSDTLSYRRALTLATLATAAGSLASLLLAEALVQSFSGKGLVPDALVNAPAFMLGVAGGAAFTVFLATRLGLPVSTTHALIGGLIGAGLGQQGGEVHWMPLAQTFVAPLLVSPLLAAGLSLLASRRLGARVAAADCACLVAPAAGVASPHGVALAQRVALPGLVLGRRAQCEHLDAAVKLPLGRSLDRLHIASAMSICFARSVNDTPKLAALLLAAQAWGAALSTGAIAFAMALGGLLFAGKVAHTMSRRVTRLGRPQGLAANVVTAAIVLFASKLGLPVSTTHVALGAIAGVGAGARSLDRAALRNVLLSWVATLPLAGAAAYLLTRLA